MPLCRWTVYEIGQRVAPRVTQNERLFIAGGGLALSVVTPSLILKVVLYQMHSIHIRLKQDRA